MFQGLIVLPTFAETIQGIESRREFMNNKSPVKYLDNK